jgi:steroid 5-alpha reductase family enzyme
MPDISPLIFGLVIALLLPAALWVVSLVKQDVSIVDSLWSLIFLALSLVYLATSGPNTLRGLIVFVLVLVWSLRLAAYITWRNWGEPEDARYAAMRLKHGPSFAFKSLYIVFLLQGFIAWIIAMPLYAAISSNTPLGVIDGLALLLVLGGVLFESIADSQMAAFKADDNNQGRVMDKGLWRYSRHPNYFGECCVWWGFFLFAAASGGWWTIISPVLMTFLLLRVSGVALLEKDIVERRPRYRDYISRTNAFIPGAPRHRRKVLLTR